MKRILINSSYGDELRVALVDGAKLYDFDTESPDKTLLKGSIFKAKVSRVESSLDAAFVNFGSERHGFLPLKDLSNEFYKKDKKGKYICTLEEGQEIIVQVTKEERDPDESFMRSIEEVIGITGSARDAYRSDVTAYMFSKMIRGEKVNYKSYSPLKDEIESYQRDAVDSMCSILIAHMFRALATCSAARVGDTPLVPQLR